MKTSKYLFVISSIIVLNFCSPQPNQNNMGWDQADSILKRIIPPVFPDKNFNIADYGAIANDELDDFKAIKDAIIDCSLKGGGKVIIPAGEYVCNGPITLKSNINLHLQEGVIIKFSTNPDDYLPIVLTRWEGVECYNYSPLIYAYKQENIAVTGKGILDGGANEDNWWAWKGRVDMGWMENTPCQSDSNSRPLLMKMNDESTPVSERVFGKDRYLRPNFIQTIQCNNILIEGVTFLDSPMWFIHPVLCRNVSILNVTTKSIGPNTDGCDPESCADVLIKGCYFSNGDDCIAIKSGRNNDGRRINVPSENFVIQDCKMKDGHGGVVIGSEISGNVRNIFAENCEMDSPNLDRAIRLKSNTFRGGVIENIFVRNITVGQVGEAVIKMNMKYAPAEGADGGYLPVMRNVFIENVTSKKSPYAFYFDGLDNSKIHDITVKDCKFDSVRNESIISNIEKLNLENVFINGIKL